MNLHLEVMSEAQMRVLSQLAPAADAHGFYLAGGTAVALQLGHRVSVDLNWFTPDGLADPLRLLSHLREIGFQPESVTTDAGTLHTTLDGVRTTFLEYRYPLVAELRDGPDARCRIASLHDLASAKLSAITGRGARRDFLDVYAIARSGITLRRMLELYTLKFGVEEWGHVLRSLVYFDDAEEERMPRMLDNVEWADVRAAIERWVKEVVEESE